MWIQISSGRGPDECELAVGHFLRRLLDEHKSVKVIDAEPGYYAGNFKSVLVSIDDDELDDIGGAGNGTILWICKSPYRPSHRRKNWFINLEVYQSAENSNFSDTDVRMEAIRSSGPGGQNVNKVETGIRAIHLPTGLTVTACEERSQHMNKKLALARLSNFIRARNEENINSQKRSLWMQHNLLTRGNPIRVYEGEKFKLRS